MQSPEKTRRLDFYSSPGEMNMFDHTLYLPILKGRLGEYGALREMSPEVKAKVIPVIEIPPIPWNFADDEPSVTIDRHLSSKDWVYRHPTRTYY